MASRLTTELSVFQLAPTQPLPPKRKHLKRRHTHTHSSLWCQVLDSRDSDEHLLKSYKTSTWLSLYFPDQNLVVLLNRSLYVPSCGNQLYWVPAITYLCHQKKRDLSVANGPTSLLPLKSLGLAHWWPQVMFQAAWSCSSARSWRCSNFKFGSTQKKVNMAFVSTFIKRITASQRLKRRGIKTHEAHFMESHGQTGSSAGRDSLCRAAIE